MCQGCADMLEYEAIVDGFIAKELPKLLCCFAQPIDHAVIYGPQWDADRRANLKALLS